MRDGEKERQEVVVVLWGCIIPLLSCWVFLALFSSPSSPARGGREGVREGGRRRRRDVE